MIWYIFLMKRKKRWKSINFECVWHCETFPKFYFCATFLCGKLNRTDLNQPEFYLILSFRKIKVWPNFSSHSLGKKAKRVGKLGKNQFYKFSISHFDTIQPTKTTKTPKWQKKSKTYNFQNVLIPPFIVLFSTVVTIDCSTRSVTNKWKLNASCFDESKCNECCKHFVLISSSCIDGTASTLISIQTKSDGHAISGWFEFVVEHGSGQSRCQSTGKSRLAETCYVLG